MPNGGSGNGGDGGGGGALGKIVNYSGHSAGQVVNVNFSGDVWFDSPSVVLAKSASGSTGGAAVSSVGTTKFSGGNGGDLNRGHPVGVVPPPPGGVGGGGGGRADSAGGEED